MTILSGGLEYNWLNMQKTRKIERVTAAQDDDLSGLEYNWLDMQKTRNIEKVTSSERSASQMDRVTQNLVARSRRAYPEHRRGNLGGA
jgi:hypothetical protein